MKEWTGQQLGNYRLLRLLGRGGFADTGHGSDVEGVAWSSDSTRIASGSLDKTVQIWNATNGNLILMHRQPDWINAVVWSLNRANIASGSSDKTVQVWSATSGQTSLTFTGHSDVVQAVAWSPDSMHVASASNDMTVQVWSAVA